MSPEVVIPPQAELRPASDVMRLDRMGSFFPTRLSFMRSLVRELAAEDNPITRPVWEIDDDGYGRAVYRVELGGHTYSLVAVSTPLHPDDRTDRVIAEAWDSSYVLFDGVPTTADLDRIQASAPLQEGARFDSRDLVLSRANKSVRLFEHVVDRLSAGVQPDLDMVGSIGYLMRTTAVYGNGKFGIADRYRFADRAAMDHPFRAELLAVFLIRGFTIDLVEHIAKRRAPTLAVALDRSVKRNLGIGNATGLGMSLFLTKHPILINNWMVVRETALARVRAIDSLTEAQAQRASALIERVGLHLTQWSTDDQIQMDRIIKLRSEWEQLASVADQTLLSGPAPWDRLVTWSTSKSLECQELVAALAIEPHAELVDGLTSCMASSFEPRLDLAMSLDQVRNLIEADWTWATSIDFADTAETAQFWYVSADKREPRLGLRYEEAGSELEEPLDVARRLHALNETLEGSSATMTTAEFLAEHPEHRDALRRVQTVARYPYAEIRDNLISDRCRPIDMLRSKLSFFGAAKFDPKSDKWTRITMYQGAPLPGEIGHGATVDELDDWWLPVLTVPAS